MKYASKYFHLPPRICKIFWRACKKVKKEKVREAEASRTCLGEQNHCPL
jgi:hypothetical protein